MCSSHYLRILLLVNFVGPLSNTCADFWRMVWIEKVEAIVMLTRTVESGKV